MLAAGETKQRAMDKINALIERGRQNATRVIEHVMTNQPADYIVKAPKMRFASDQDGLTIGFDGHAYGLHRHALGQLAESANMPTRFIESLQVADWGRELVAHNLNEIYGHRENKRYLLRSVSGQVRGFLSDQYRRLDSRPIVEAFASGVQRLGALPYEGYVMDTKITLKAIMPQVFEPIPGEVMAYGVALENSDFGNGALSFRAFLLRIWCVNLALTEEAMRQVHLGKRLSDDLIYSQRTYELDSKATVSALSDIIRNQLGMPRLQAHMEAVRQAQAQGLRADEAKAMLRRMLDKGDADRVIEAYNSPDVEMLPPGNTVWRLSNALSWVAGQTEEAEKKLELMKAAGSLLDTEKAPEPVTAAA